MKQTGLFLLIVLSLNSARSAETVSELERLRGFAQHNQGNQEFDRKRLQDVDEIKKKRQQWEETLQQAVSEHKAAKQKQAQALTETSPEYQNDLAEKRKKDSELEQARIEYIKQRNAQKAQRQSTVHLSEEEELGLNLQAERVDPAKRHYSGGRPSSSGRSSSPGNADFNTPPSDYLPPPPPPPPPPLPEFYESDGPAPIPPPPEFDEPIPPPVFDDPDF